jgi:hypothetical protein
MDQRGGGPVQPGVDQRFQISALFSGQTNNVFNVSYYFIFINLSL